jgi:tetratricopeptide (TPR) repeat protein
MRVRGPAALAALLVAQAGSLAAQSLPYDAPVPRALVVPFENVSGESRIFWLQEASAVLLADNLNALGANALTGEERREAFERLQVPRADALTDATVIRIGELVGAGEVVVGTLRIQGETLLVQARSITLETGRLRVSVAEGGPVVDLFAIFERMARRLTPPSARPPADIQSGLPPVGAFENYIKGVLAETPATAVNYLNAALKVQPAYARARLALWRVHDEQGEHERALAAVTRVPVDSPWSSRARFLAALSQINLRRYDEAFATLIALSEEQPSIAAPTLRASLVNNIGVVQTRRGGTPQSGRAAYYFNEAAEADPADPDYFFNLGYAYWFDHDVQAAIYWLREAVRRDPTDGEAHFVLGVALAAAGNQAEATREKELARRLTATYDEWARRPAADPVPRGLERMKTGFEGALTRQTDEALQTIGQRDQQELARFHLERGRRLFEEENNREALTELSRAVFLTPYLPEAHLLIGRIHLRGGRTQDAIDALKISLWSEETAAAHLVLAEAYLDAREPALAQAEAERAVALDPSSPVADILQKARSLPPR